MASLRDVLTHIGRRASLERAGVAVGEGLAIVRGTQGFTEPQLRPDPGDTLRMLDSGESFRVVSASAQEVRGRVDHYRLELSTAVARS